MRPLRVASCLVLALAAAPRPALAQSDAEREAAALFAEGRVAIERNDFASACPKFEASLKLLVRAGAQLNLARCAEHDGALLLAKKRWEDGIALLEANDERVVIAKERLAALEKRIPRLSIKLAEGAPANARVTLDGSEFGPLAEARRVDPGKHLLVVTAPDRLDQSSTITLVEGEQRELLLSSGPPRAVAPPPPPPPPSDRRPIGYAVGAVGLAGFAVFGVTGGILVGNDATITANCDENKVCNPDGWKAVQRTKPLLIVNGIGLGVGIAGVLAGVILVATSGRDAAERTSGKSKAPAAALSLGPGPGTLGLSVGRDF